MSTRQEFKFEIIIVDNASPVQDVDSIQREFGAAVVIKNPSNLGFARANNVGFSRSSGEYVLFLNPDTKMICPAINIMLERLKSVPDAGALGCTLLNGNLSIQSSCIQAFPTILNQALDSEFLRRHLPTLRLWGTASLFDRDIKIASVEVISGACMMIRRDAFETVGMFSENYFMYAEDVDLCYKLFRGGYKNYYTPTTRIIHYGGTSSNRLSAVSLKWKAAIQYCVKNQGRRYALAFRATLAVVAVVRLAILGSGFLLGGSRNVKRDLHLSLQKWTRVLQTLITYSGREDGRSRIKAVG